MDLFTDSSSGENEGKKEITEITEITGYRIRRLFLKKREETDRFQTNRKMKSRLLRRRLVYGIWILILTGILVNLSHMPLILEGMPMNLPNLSLPLEEISPTFAHTPSVLEGTSPEFFDLSVKTGEVQNPSFLAWWGTMYPKFCFKITEKEKTGESSTETSGKRRVKISFWLAQALDW